MSRYNPSFLTKVSNWIGSLAGLKTAAKTSVVAAINEHDDKLGSLSTLKFLADIDSTIYKNGSIISYESICTQQAINYGKFYQKLRNGTAVQIACIGDSLTYGYDLYSADKVVSANIPADDGSVDGNTMASTTYPQALQTFLNQVYNNTVTVVKRGYSGDWVPRGYTRWYKKHSSDLSIIMYGTNDGNPANTWVPNAGDISTYLTWYEQFIIREIVWGKAVIILTPPKQKTANATAVDEFSNALYLLGEKYGVPVVDSEDFTRNYDQSIYSDSIHFNGTGYQVIASRVASLLIGEGVKHVNMVGNGSKLLTRPTIDNIVYLPGTNFTTTTPTDSPTESSAGNGIVASIPGSGGVVYSFYANQDDLVVLPYSFLVSGATMTVTLDFAVPQAQNSLDNAVFASMTNSDGLINSVTYPSMSPNYTKKYILDNNLSFIRIPSKGWHTIKITSATNVTILNGIEFLSYEDVMNYKNWASGSQTTGSYIGYSHASWSASPPAVTQTLLNWTTVRTAMGLPDIGSQNYKGVALKITVTNYDQSILTYYFTQGLTNSATGWDFIVSSPNRINIATTPDERTITSMSYDSTNNNLVINWGGNTSRLTSFAISVL